MDIWPLYLFHPGAVTVNVAVNILTRCRIASLPGSRIHLKSIDTGREEEFASLDELCITRRYKHPLAAYLIKFFRPEGGFEVETNSESPAGAGISGSSALMIATTAALARYTGRKLDREEIRVIAQNAEAQLIRVPTGCQDYYPALYGGVSALHLDLDGIHREAIAVAADELDRRFVLAASSTTSKASARLPAPCTKRSRWPTGTKQRACCAKNGSYAKRMLRRSPRPPSKSWSR